MEVTVFWIKEERGPSMRWPTPVLEGTLNRIPAFPIWVGGLRWY